jgi:glycosyltransferase involved in cell wall biosynthesis
MKFIAVHAGSRDEYQIPLALYESGQLECFVTDAYKLDHDTVRAQVMKNILSKTQRKCGDLDDHKVICDQTALVWAGLSSIFNRLIKSKKLVNAAHSRMDRALSMRALAESLDRHADIFATSYYAADAFRHLAKNGRSGILFQVHPSPKAVKQLLTDELKSNPIAIDSLSAEKELNSTDAELELYADESHLARRILCASSFTKRTLVEQGINADKIVVCPYGVDFKNFTVRKNAPDYSKPLTVFWLGSLVQRKGLSYFLEALSRFPANQIQAVCCTRTQPDRRLLNHYKINNLTIKSGLSVSEVVIEMKKADVYVLPSVAEGFGHSIAQAMAVGLPVVASENTMASDCVTDGAEGFVIPIRSTEALYDRLAWCLDNRRDLAEMGQVAASTIRTYTWERFRLGVSQFARESI